MNFRTQARPTFPTPSSFAPVARPILQRKCACGGTPGPDGECAECKRKRLARQTKLPISQPGDPYEREADRITEQVMRLPAALPTAARSTYRAFRSIQRKTSDESPEGAGGAGAALVNDVICSSGQPLDSATREFFEPRFGYTLVECACMQMIGQRNQPRP